MPSLTPNVKGALSALAAFAIYASHDAAIKALGDTYSTFQIVFFAAALGLPLALVQLARSAGGLSVVPRNPGWMALRVVAVISSGFFGFYAFSQMPLAQAYAIFFAAPLFVTLLAVPMLGERLGVRRIGAVLVGLVGVLVVLRPGGEGAALGLGHLAALLAAFSTGLSGIITRRIGGQERAALLVLYPILGNVVIMGVILPFVYVPMTVGDFALLVFVAVCSYIAMLLIVAAYRMGEAVVIAPMQYSQIIWATIFGAVFFAEFPDLMTYLGAAIVIGSGIFIVLRESKQAVSRVQPVLTTPPRGAAAAKVAEEP